MYTEILHGSCTLSKRNIRTCKNMKTRKTNSNIHAVYAFANQAWVLRIMKWLHLEPIWTKAVCCPNALIQERQWVEGCRMLYVCLNNQPSPLCSNITIFQIQ